MKKRFYFAALVAAVALASCTEKNAGLVEPGEMMELFVNVPRRLPNISEIYTRAVITKLP